ncbi:MAG: T9SS type A sorting domain-containing protein [Candidatus Eisenbacteria bacterium]|nr:T9SS type A sorting domain-containing protein [Candidatus Latescibacterota bacterium]MBD3301356.1 T9SS type A sorting domain-containing protein [Candidatus Eisenbacteria bacterium]
MPGTRPTMIRTFVILTSLVPLAIGVAAAQTGDENWSVEFDGAGLIGRVFALGTYNGELVAGGYREFRTDGRTIDHVARLSGDEWLPFGSGVSGPVRDVVVYDGDLVVAGEFTTAGGAQAQSVARWDGSQWHPLGAGLELSWWFEAEVWALAVYEGELYAGGNFDESGGQPLHFIAKWTGSEWVSVGGGVDGSYEPKVLDMVVHEQKLIVCGEFDTAGGQPARGIAAWDGSSWSPLGEGLDGNLTSVFAVESHDGNLYAGGNFQVAGGDPSIENLAEWDGSSWNDIGEIPDWDISVAVYSLQSYQGSLYVGGDFIEAGGVSSSRVARYDGNQWHSVGGIFGTDLATTAIAMTVLDEKLYIGGEFDYGGPGGLALEEYTFSSNVIGYDGSDYFNAGDGLGFDGGAVKLLDYDGGIFAAGGFAGAGNALAINVGFFDGTDWRPMGYIQGGQIDDAILFEGEIVIVGGFDRIDGQEISNVARHDGTEWLPMGPTGGGDVLEIYDGELYAAGLGQPIKWNGATWERVGPSGTVFGQAYDMEVYDGKLFVGGYLGGEGLSPNLIAWNGSSWENVGDGTNDTVAALTVHQDELIVGGWFTQVGGGVAANTIAAWDGSSWREFGGGLAASVNSLASVGDLLFASGGFNPSVGIPMQFVGYWDGSQWNAMGSGINAYAWSFLPDPAEGVVYVGGGFSEAGGVPAGGLTTWRSMEAPSSTPEDAGSAGPPLVLGSPFPNPFRDETTVRFALPDPQPVSLAVFDVVGRRVATLAEAVLSAGSHAVRWDGTARSGNPVPKGIYFLRLQTPDGTRERKVNRID